MSDPPPIVRIFLLGEPRLEYAGQTLPLPRRESLLILFAHLILKSGQTLSRKQLAFQLWPEHPESKALANLRRHLHLLRNFLPVPLQGLLLITPSSVRWQDSEMCWVDVKEFLNADERLESLQRAASLYRGDLTDGVEGDPFLSAQREAIFQKYLTLLRHLAKGYAQKEQIEHALVWTGRLLELDPWDEEVVQLKMKLEAKSGKRAAALQTYQSFVRQLQNELKIDPLPETETLYHDIRANRMDCSLALKKCSSSPLLCRERELEELLDVFTSLNSGHGRIVFVSGVAGVGKTFLVQEALRRLVEELGEAAPLILWVSCPPPPADSCPLPYAPWSQALNAAAPWLVRNESVTPQWLSRLLPLVPDLALLRPNLIPPEQPSKAELRAALRQAFHALALTKSLILVLEDAHWADEDSLEVLQELVESSVALPLLFLVTHRSEEVPPLLLKVKHALRKRRHATEIPLLPLDEEETQFFLKAFLGEAEISPKRFTEINLFANGLPLFLREAVDMIRSAKRGQSGLPSLQDSILLRIKQLSQPAREMLEAAAMLGFSFSDLELEALLGKPLASFAAALDALHASRFLSEELLPGTQHYTFSHQLVHQIILEAIPQERRPALHRRVAAALQEVYADQSGVADRIAAHYQAAGMPLLAARFWLEHARQIIDLAEFNAALRIIASAQSLLETLDKPESRKLYTQAILLRGVIAHHRGQSAAAISQFEEALAQSKAFPALHAQALSSFAYALYSCDRYAEAWQAADDSLRLARSQADPQAILRALNIRGTAALMLGRIAEAVQDLQQTLAQQGSSTQLSFQMVQSYNHLGTALVFAGDYSAAYDTLSKAVDLARRGGQKRIESAALMMQGQIALNRGQYPLALELYSQSIQVAGRSYLPGLWGKFAGRGATYLRSGRLSEAQADFEQGLAIARQVNSTYGSLLMRVYLAFTALAMGKPPQDSLFTLEEDAASFDLPAVVLLASLSRGVLRRLLGDFEQAELAQQRAMRVAQASGVPQFRQNAQLEWLLTQAQRGIPNLADLDSLAAQAQARDEMPQQSLIKLICAYNRYGEKRYDQAIAAAQDALALARSCPDRILSGEALRLLLPLHQAIGQSEETQICHIELRKLAKTAFAPFHICLNSPSAPTLRQLIIAST